MLRIPAGDRGPSGRQPPHARRPGRKRLAVRIASTAEQFARKWAKTAEIRSYHTNAEACEAVRAGVAGAWVEDGPIAQWFADRIPELELGASVEGTEAHYGIMFRKGNDALRRAVDRVLARLRADGTYERLYEGWFGLGATRDRARAGARAERRAH